MKEQIAILVDGTVVPCCLDNNGDIPLGNIFEQTIEEILSTTDIDGLECEYPSFTIEQRQFLKVLCKKYNKFMSGGSDYHALNDAGNRASYINDAQMNWILQIMNLIHQNLMELFYLKV